MNGFSLRIESTGLRYRATLFGPGLPESPSVSAFLRYAEREIELAEERLNLATLEAKRGRLGQPVFCS